MFLALKHYFRNNIIITGTTEPVTDVNKVKEFCEEVGFPVILKAAFGGGGRGMRMVAELPTRTLLRKTSRELSPKLWLHLERMIC
jgi:Pyruvate carboxylase